MVTQVAKILDKIKLRSYVILVYSVRQQSKIAFQSKVYFQTRTPRLKKNCIDRYQLVLNPTVAIRPPAFKTTSLNTLLLMCRLKISKIASPGKM